MGRSIRMLMSIVAVPLLGVGAAVSAMPAAASAAASEYKCSEFSPRPYISVLRPGLEKPTTRDRKVLGITGGLKTDRARAIIADYHGDPNQQWWVRSCSIDDFRQTFWHQIQNAKSSKCLDKSEDAPNGNGNIIYQYTCGRRQ